MFVVKCYVKQFWHQVTSSLIMWHEERQSTSSARPKVLSGRVDQHNMLYRTERGLNIFSICFWTAICMLCHRAHQIQTSSRSQEWPNLWYNCQNGCFGIILHHKSNSSSEGWGFTLWEALLKTRFSRGRLGGFSRGGNPTFWISPQARSSLRWEDETVGIPHRRNKKGKRGSNDTLIKS